MANTKFTAGPWEVGEHSAVVASVPVDGGPLGSDEVQYYGGHLVCESVTEANASLIAAAPELYEALKAIIEHRGRVGKHDCPGYDCALCECPTEGWGDAYRAIAKAEARNV